MIRKMLIKCCRYENYIRTIAKICVVIAFILIICNILARLQIEPFLKEMSKIIFFCKISLNIGIITETISNSLEVIKRNKKKIYVNKIFDVLLSSRKVVCGIIIITFYIVPSLIGYKAWMCFLCIILIIKTPKNVEKYFKEKLKK